MPLFLYLSFLFSSLPTFSPSCQLIVFLSKSRKESDFIFIFILIIDYHPSIREHTVWASIEASVVCLPFLHPLFGYSLLSFLCSLSLSSCGSTFASPDSFLFLFLSLSLLSFPSFRRSPKCSVGPRQGSPPLLPPSPTATSTLNSTAALVSGGSEWSSRMTMAKRRRSSSRIAEPIPPGQQ